MLFELATEVNKSRSAEAAGLLKVLAGHAGPVVGDPEGFPAGRRHWTKPPLPRWIQRRADAARTSPRPTRSARTFAGARVVLKDSPPARPYRNFLNKNGTLPRETGGGF